MTAARATASAASSNGASSSRSPNGNLLIIEAFGGRAFEVTTDAQPRVVWEYVNRLPAQDGKPRRGLVGEAHRFPYDALTFVSRPTAGPDASPPTRAVAPSAG